MRTSAPSLGEVKRYVRQRLERVLRARWYSPNREPGLDAALLGYYLAGKAAAYRDVLDEIERLEAE